MWRGGRGLTVVATSGRFTEGRDKGKSWEIYQDPASKSGWTRKVWNPYDTSNDGKPTEYFGEFDYGAAEVDAQSSANKAAEAAAKNAQQEAAAKAAKDEADRKAAGFWQGVQATNERTYQEGVRQFNEGQALKSREVDLRAMDQRDRMRLGLRELELNEKTAGNTDQRNREKNVLDYLGAIGKLKLPYPELVALSQRAIAGIVPGGAGQGGKNGGGGALTADQWAALGNGVVRDWETRQVGQGNPLA